MIHDQVLDDHARLRRRFAELEATGHSQPRLCELWAELAVSLLAHLEVAEEICYPPLFDGASDLPQIVAHLSACKADIRDTAFEASLAEAGSHRWWLAVRAAQDATDQYFDSLESGLLPRFGQQITERTRRARPI